MCKSWKVGSVVPGTHPCCLLTTVSVRTEEDYEMLSAVPAKNILSERDMKLSS